MFMSTDAPIGKIVARQLSVKRLAEATLYDPATRGTIEIMLVKGS